jgi:hypothetical protein
MLPVMKREAGDSPLQIVQIMQRWNTRVEMQEPAPK